MLSVLGFGLAILHFLSSEPDAMCSADNDDIAAELSRAIERGVELAEQAASESPMAVAAEALPGGALPSFPEEVHVRHLRGLLVHRRITAPSEDIAAAKWGEEVRYTFYDPPNSAAAEAVVERIRQTLSLFEKMTGVPHTEISRDDPRALTRVIEGVGETVGTNLHFVFIDDWERFELPEGPEFPDLDKRRATSELKKQPTYPFQVATYDVYVPVDEEDQAQIGKVVATRRYVFVGTGAFVDQIGSMLHENQQGVLQHVLLGSLGFGGLPVRGLLSPAGLAISSVRVPELGFYPLGFGTLDLVSAHLFYNATSLRSGLPPRRYEDLLDCHSTLPLVRDGRTLRL